MRLGDYELGDLIGRGGMGAVYRARAPSGEAVAIKVLLAGSGAAQARERFEREGRLLASFTAEEGFVPLLDRGSTEHGPYLVMPFVDGGSLRDRLMKGRLAVDETAALGLALARTLGHAHAKGVIHRDLKPENILFVGPRGIEGAGPGSPLVADLGLGKHVDGGLGASTALSRTGEIRGTMGYAPREQLESSKDVGPTADVFSLGAVLYECLAGEPPFLGATPFELLDNMSASKFLPLKRHRPDAPAHLVAAIERALSPDPADRFADGSALARALGGAGSSRSRLLVPLAVGVLLATGAGAIIMMGGGPRVGLRKAPPPGTPAREAAAVATARADPAPRDRREEARALLARADASKVAPADVATLASQALALDPTLADAWERRGLALARTDKDLALSDLARAIELDPKNAERHSARASVLLNAWNDAAGATFDAEKAVELAPSAETYLLRGACRLLLNDLDRAHDDFEQVTQLDPANPGGWSHLGITDVHRGHGKLGLKSLNRSIELAPDAALTYRWRGDTYAAMGSFKAAIADYEHFLELEPEGVLSNKVRASLAKVRAKVAPP